MSLSNYICSQPLTTTSGLVINAKQIDLSYFEGKIQRLVMHTLEKYRNHWKANYQQMGYLVGVSGTVYYNWLRGKVKMPVVIIEAYAEAFGYDLDEFIKEIFNID